MYGFVNRYNDNGIILNVLFIVCIHVHFVVVNYFELSGDDYSENIFMGLEPTLI
jgi:hypothetical protein